MSCAESRNAFDDGCARDAGVEEKVENAGVNRNVVMFRSIAQVECHFYRFARSQHVFLQWPPCDAATLDAWPEAKWTTMD